MTSSRIRLSTLVLGTAACLAICSGCKSPGMNSLTNSSEVASQGGGQRKMIHAEISSKKGKSVAVQLFNILSPGDRAIADFLGEDSDFLPPSDSQGQLVVGNDSIVCVMKKSDKIHCTFTLTAISTSDHDKNFETNWEPMYNTSLASELNRRMGRTPRIADKDGNAIKCDMNTFNQVKCSFQIN